MAKTKKSLQTELDSIRKGAALPLVPGEYEGPISIRNPVDIDGQGSTIWGHKGPVVTINSENVVLRNTTIEVTDEFEVPQSDGCALLIQSRAKPTLENVEVRGTVIGLHGEEGEWCYPNLLDLGALAYGVKHKFRIRIVVPVPCKLESCISGVRIEPVNLTPGYHDIYCYVERLLEDIMIYGDILIITSLLKRKITVNGHICRKGEGGDQGTGQLLWEPQIKETIIEHSKLFTKILPIPGLYASSVKGITVENLPKFAHFDDQKLEFQFHPSPDQVGQRYQVKFVINMDTDQQVIELPIQVSESNPQPEPEKIEPPEARPTTNWTEPIMHGVKDIITKLESEAIDVVKSPVWNVYARTFLWIYNLIALIAGAFAVLLFVEDLLVGYSLVLILEGIYIIAASHIEQIQKVISNK
jgi:hypothetical protein